MAGDCIQMVDASEAQHNVTVAQQKERLVYDIPRRC